MLQYEYDKLILATGSKTKSIGIAGESGAECISCEVAVRWIGNETFY